MKNLFIEFNSNYADEFDISGFLIMSEEEWEEHKLVAEKRFSSLEPTERSTRRGESPSLEVYFGTNEQIIYESLSEYLRSFTVTEISDEERATLEKFFKPSWGPLRYGTLAMIEAE